MRNQKQQVNMDGLKRKEPRIYSKASLKIGKHKSFHLQGRKDSKLRMVFEFVSGIAERITKTITKTISGLYEVGKSSSIKISKVLKKSKALKSATIVLLHISRTICKKTAKLIKKYLRIFKQIDLARRTVAVITILILITTIFFQNSQKIQGATYTFLQTDWSGGVTANIASHLTDQTGWDEYSAADSNVTAGTEIALTQSSGYATDDTTLTTDASATGGGFNNGTMTTVENSSDTIQLTKDVHINEYTIGSLANITAIASAVSSNSNNTYTITFNNSPDLSRIFKNDKFTDSAANAYKVLTVNDENDKIIVVDSEENFTVPAAGSGTAGRWFSSISAWETGREGDLVARNAIERGLPYYDGSADTTAVTISGWTTDATHYIEITTPLSERHRGVWDDNKYRISGNATPQFEIAEEYTRIIGLQLTTSSETVVDFSASNGLIEQSIVKSPTRYGIRNINSSTGTIVRNCLVYDTGRYGIGTESGSMTIYNSTVVNAGWFGIGIASGGTIIATNNLAYNNGDGSSWFDFQDSVGATYNYNASADSSADDRGGTGNRVDQTFTFTDEADDDFHLAAVDTGAKDQGTDLSGSFSTDIDSDERTGTWDIGADDAGASLTMAHSIGTASRQFATLQGWEDARDGVLTARNVFKISSQSAAFTEGETITGTSGATGTYIKEQDTPSASEIYMTVDKLNGTAFLAGDTLTGGSSGSTTTLDAVLTASGTVEKGEAYDDSTFTAGLTINDSTTDTTHYMHLSSSPGSRHAGIYGGGAKISYSSGDYLIFNNDSYTVIEGLIIENTNTTSPDGITCSSGGGSDGVVIRNNIIKAATSGLSGGSGIYENINGDNREFYNNVIIGFYQGINTRQNSLQIYNNTIYGSVETGIYRNDGSPDLRNNIVVSSGTNDYDINAGSWGVSSGYNISSDATASGTGSLTNQDLSQISFVSTDSTIMDLHLIPNSVARDAGMDLSGTFPGDIDGQARSGTFDIGADEWISSSPIYNSSGNFESATIDMGSQVDFSTMNWNPTSQPSNTDMRIQVAANNDNSTWDYIDLNEEAYPTGVTVVEKTIREDGAGDYTTLAAWEAAEQKDLVAANEIAVARIEGSWTSAESAEVNIWTWTTGPNNYIRIYTAQDARHSGVWDDTKYRIEPGAGADGIDNLEDYVRIEGIQVSNVGGSGTGIEVRNMNSDNDVRVSHNILKGDGSTVGPGLEVSGGDYNIRAWNNIIYGYARSYRGAMRIVGGGSGKAYLYSNTMYDNNYGISLGTGRDGTAKNNIVQDIVTSAYSGTFNSESDYNLSDNTDNTGGANDITLANVTFADEAGDDFRLDPGDTAAKDQGTDLSSDSHLALSGDVEMQIRSGTWDIGADEQGASGSLWPSSIDDKQYFRYRAFFETKNIAATSRLQDITTNYNYYSTSQILTSSAYDTNDSNNLIGGLSWTEDSTLPTGTGVTISLKTASSEAGLSSASWSDFTNATADCSKASGLVTCTSDAIPAAMKIGGDDQWLQYKTTLTSSGAYTPTVSDITTTYVVNGPPEVQNVAASQGTDGIVTVDYEARDADTTSGATPNAVNVTLQYCTANCSTPGSETWTDAVTVAGDAGAGVSVQEVSWTSHSLTWTAKTDYGDQYNATDFKIRIRADDGEGANNFGYGQSSAFTIDTTDPAPGAVPVSIDASAVPADITLSATDDSSLEMKVGLASDLSDAAWEAYNSSKTLTLASDPDIAYAQFKDAYGNTSSILNSTTPETPTNVMVQDTSNINATPPEYRLFLGWQTVDEPTPGFSQYNILRSTDDITYASIATETDRTTNYYGDSTVAYDVDYYYKITSQDSDGNISYRSDSVYGKANGTQDAGEGSVVTSPLTAISGISSPPSVLTDEKAVITFNTDQSANCTIEYGTQSGNYNEVPVSEASYNRNHSMHLVGLIAETAYYYQITCADNLTNVSTVVSSEYSFTTLETQYSETAAGNLGDGTTPDISGIKAKDITGEKVTISWKTNENANSLVKYGVTENYGTMAGNDTVNSDVDNYAKSHEVVIQELIPDTKYYFIVISIDSSGNIAESSQKTFTTNSPAKFNTINVASDNLGEVIMTWITDEKMTSIVDYGLTTSFGETKEDTTKTKEHEIVLSDLESNETYHFRVKGKDEDDNLYASSDYTFIPKSPPQIFNIKVDSISEHDARVTFDTDVPTDTLITYADISNSDNSGAQGKPELTTVHEVELKDLIPGTNYAMVVRVKDDEGNETEDGSQTFITGKDENPPEIRNIKTETALSQGDKVQAIIVWDTDELGTTSLIYKEGRNSLEKEALIDSNHTLGHAAIITTFNPGTVYYFKAKSIDEAGNEAISGEHALLTPRRKENIIQVIINNFQEIFGWARN